MAGGAIPGGGLPHKIRHVTTRGQPYHAEGGGTANAQCRPRLLSAEDPVPRQPLGTQLLHDANDALC